MVIASIIADEKDKVKKEITRKIIKTGFRPMKQFSNKSYDHRRLVYLQ